jgi:acyl-CoA reductase-like NAD-dependent aldehyde dehydrogenase
MDCPLHFELFYDGAFQASRTDRRITVLSPAMGGVVDSVPDVDEAYVAGAVQSARAAIEDGRWAGLDPLDRAQTLNRVADALADRIAEFVVLGSVVTGRPVRDLTAQLACLPDRQSQADHG